MRRLLLAAAAALLASGGLWTTPAASQIPPPAPPAAPAIGDAQASIGIVTIDDDKRAVGWLASSGVVMMPIRNAKQVGDAATFALSGSGVVAKCYVADRDERLGVAALRCQQTAGKVAQIASGHPAVGTPSTALYLPSVRNSAPRFEAGAVTAGDVTFMGSRRLRFSFPVSPDRYGGLTAEVLPGTLVIDGSGQVISTLIVAPVNGGEPLGSTPGELRRMVADTAPLPESFPTAAVVAIARRAAIPAAVGVVLGIVWGLLSRNNTLVVKALGLAAVGVMSAIAYSLFTMLVIGPETLLG